MIAFGKFVFEPILKGFSLGIDCRVRNLARTLCVIIR